MFHFFVFNLDKNQLFIYSIFSEEYSYTFTRFPLKNSEVLVKWENPIKKYGRQGNNWKATQFSRICSKHFLKTDFTNDANRWFKCNVIPSVFNGSQTAATRHPKGGTVQVPPLSSEVTMFQTDGQQHRYHFEQVNIIASKFHLYPAK